MIDQDSLPDIQNTSPLIHLPINQVGVENVEVPFLLESKYNGFRQLNANVSIRTNLDANTKGISMSRLLLTLKPYLDLPLKQTLIKKILEDIRDNIGSKNSFIKFEFRMPIIKKSIKSDNSFPIYYKCRFEGQLFQKSKMIHGVSDTIKHDTFKFYQGVIIQYASYCPCSAELCGDLNNKGYKGYPHNQRSFAEVLIETHRNYIIWLEDIIELIHDNIKTLPMPIIKRIDEQEIARIAAENPMFVEDAIRTISNALNNKEEIYDWIVKTRHEESIHTSEAIAINWKGIKNGFTGRRYL